MRSAKRAPAGAALSLALVAALLAGCNQNVDLTAVSKVAATALSSRTSFESIAADYADSCRRQASASAYLQQTPAACDDDVAVSKGWSTVNAAWFAYFEALEDLAGSSTQTDYGFNTIASDVDGNKTLKARVPQADGIAKALQSLVTAIVAARRRSAIGDSVPAAMAALQRCGEAQTELARIYTLELENERGAVTAVYHLRARTYGNEGYAVEKDRLHDLAAIDDKERAAAAYQTAIQTTLAAQTALLQKIQSNSYGDLISIAIDYDTAFKADVLPLGKAFK